MKLISCHIDAFGKLKNVDFEFKDFSVLCQKNGFGKTTLAEFLKAMFYGISASSKKANVLSERDLYRPFDFDGKFGGQIKFSCKQGTFIAIRAFSTTPTLDKFTLIDATTNLQSNEFSSNLGEELFGVGKETYENTTFFAQQELFSGINDDMRASLSTGVLSGDDVDNLQNALTNIQKKSKELRSEGKELKLEERQKEMTNLISKEEILKIKISNIEKQIVEAEYLKKQAESEEKDFNEDQVNGFIKKKIALESMNDIVDKNLEIKNNRKHNLERDKKFSQQDYDFLKENKQNFANNSKKRITLFVLLALTVLFALGAVLGGVFKQQIFLYVFLVVVILLAIGVFLCFLNVNKYSLTIKNYKEILRKYGIEFDGLETELATFEEAEKEIKFLNEDIENLNKEMAKNQMAYEDLENAFYAKFGCFIEDFSIKKSSNQIMSIEKKLIELNADKRHFLLDLDNLQERKFEVTENLDEQQEKALALQKKLQLLSTTAQFLEKAKNNISHRFIEPVTAQFNKYYKTILQDGEQITIDSNLNLTFSDFKDVKFLSAGLFDLVCICKRFALADLLFKKEKPILILDDPFVNLDDEKLKIANNLLAELSKNYQIILMTCQKARAEV